MALVPILDVLKRHELQGLAPPSAGTFSQGDFIWNATPSPGSPVGWSCVVGGTPGVWQAQGGSAVGVAVISDADSPYLALGSDGVVAVDAAAAAVTVDLPAASAAGGRVLHVKKVDASANAVTVAADGVDAIDGAATLTLAAQYDSVTVASAGAEWLVL